MSTLNTFAENLRTDQREKAKQLHSRTVPYFYCGSFHVDIFAGNGLQPLSKLEQEIRAFEKWQAGR